MAPGESRFPAVSPDALPSIAGLDTFAGLRRPLMRSTDAFSIRHWLRANRNLWLFLSMLAIVVLLPAFEDSKVGELSFAAVNALIVIVAVAAAGGSRRVFRLALALAILGGLFRTAAFFDGNSMYFTWSWVFCAAVMVVTIMRLLHEMFQDDKVTQERLFACATTYLVIGLLWCYLYAIAVEVAPDSFTGLSANRGLHVADFAYFSFNIVTSIALTNAMPVSKTAQMLVILEEFASVMYMAFVISRLVGMYGPAPKESAKSGAPSRARR